MTNEATTARQIWALAAGDRAGELLREGGLCDVNDGDPGDLWDIELEDGRVFLRCRPLHEPLPGRACPLIDVMAIPRSAYSVTPYAKVRAAKRSGTP